MLDAHHRVDVGRLAVGFGVLALNSFTARPPVALQPSAALAIRRASNHRRGRPRSAAQEAAGDAVQIEGESTAAAGASVQ